VLRRRGVVSLTQLGPAVGGEDVGVPRRRRQGLGEDPPRLLEAPEGHEAAPEVAAQARGDLGVGRGRGRAPAGRDAPAGDPGGLLEGLAEAGHRRVVQTLGGQRPAEAMVRIGAGGVDDQAAPQGLGGLGGLPEGEARQTEIAQGAGVVGPRLDRRVELGQRALLFAEGEERRADAGPDRGVLRRELEGLAEGDEGRVGLAAVEAQQPEGRLPLDVVRVEGEGARPRLHRVAFPQLLPGPGEGDPAVPGLRGQLRRELERREGRLGLRQREQRLAEAELERSIVVVEGDGPAEAGHRVVVAAHPRLHPAELAQQIGVLALVLDRAAQGGRGLTVLTEGEARPGELHPRAHRLRVGHGDALVGLRGQIEALEGGGGVAEGLLRRDPLGLELHGLLERRERLRVRVLGGPRDAELEVRLCVPRVEAGHLEPVRLGLGGAAEAGVGGGEGPPQIEVRGRALDGAAQRNDGVGVPGQGDVGAAELHQGLGVFRVDVEDGPPGLDRGLRLALHAVRGAAEESERVQVLRVRLDRGREGVAGLRPLLGLHVGAPEGDLGAGVGAAAEAGQGRVGGGRLVVSVEVREQLGEDAEGIGRLVVQLRRLRVGDHRGGLVAAGDLEPAEAEPGPRVLGGQLRRGAERRLRLVVDPQGQAGVAEEPLRVGAPRIDADRLPQIGARGVPLLHRERRPGPPEVVGRVVRLELEGGAVGLLGRAHAVQDGQHLAVGGVGRRALREQLDGLGQRPLRLLGLLHGELRPAEGEPALAALRRQLDRLAVRLHRGAELVELLRGPPEGVVGLRQPRVEAEGLVEGVVGALPVLGVQGRVAELDVELGIRRPDRHRRLVGLHGLRAPVEAHQHVPQGLLELADARRVEVRDGGAEGLDGGLELAELRPDLGQVAVRAASRRRLRRGALEGPLGVAQRVEGPVGAAEGLEDVGPVGRHLGALR
jgi:hypothetical protein